MTTALAVYAALAWAVSDYLGGRYSKNIKSTILTFYGQCWGTIILVPLCLLMGGNPSSRDLLLGAVAGGFNVLAYTLMVEGTSRGRIGTVIPTSAVTSALIPMMFAVAMGENFSAIAQVGIFLALTGTALSASEVSESASRWTRNFDTTALFFGAASGVGFAFMFILLGHTDESAGVWPILAMRLAIPILFLFAKTHKASLTPTTQSVRYGFNVAIVGTTATAAFLLAAQGGPLAIVTVIAATSPAGSVMIAHFLRTERTSKLQMIGVLLAITGTIVLVLR